MPLEVECHTVPHIKALTHDIEHGMWMAVAVLLHTITLT